MKVNSGLFVRVLEEMSDMKTIISLFCLVAWLWALPGLAQPIIIISGQFADDAIEGPTLWQGKLYASNYRSDGQIGAIDLSTANIRPVFEQPLTGVRWNGLAATDSGLWGLDEAGKRLYWLEPDSATARLVHVFTEFSPNDLVVLNDEWLLITAPRWQQPVMGELWGYHQPTGQTIRLFTTTNELNGIALSPQGQVILSNHNQLIILNLNIQGNEIQVEGRTQSSAISWCTHMDGLKVTKSGLVMVACYDQGQLAQYDPIRQNWRALSLGLDQGNATNLVIDPSTGNTYVTVRNGWRGQQPVDIVYIPGG
jgi:gluconolactonase